MDTHLPVTGRVVITTRDVATNEIVDRQEVSNLVVLGGRNLIRDRVLGLSSLTVSHFSVGTTATTPTETDTGLGAEVTRSQVTQATANSGEILFRHFLSSTEANGVTLQEAGLHTAQSGGVMFARVTYAGVAKTSSLSITYDWTITIGAS